ncbi:MAG: HAD-IC family P-type ATPase [Candidatus Gribaldobacteria bacterium]|nr:HAD-IC family P-type ATPase [Candidatus Gribaldobacteria bacterium]
MNFSKFTNQAITEVLNSLETTEQGLSIKESKVRLLKMGLNEIKEKKAHWLKVLVQQLKSPFFYLLFAAGILAFLVGEMVDGYVIVAFILVNVVVGFLQECRSERAIASLKKIIASQARVLRDEEEVMIDKRFLVQGDIVSLENGNIVPADLRILKAQGLLVDESILTGESIPVAKSSEKSVQEIGEIFKAQNILFSGTAVTAGKAQGVVLAIGQNTTVGEISKMASGLVRQSAYEKELLFASKLMMKIVASAILFIFIANLLLHGTERFSDFLIFCIALVVSILPEALPVVATFALSKGAMQMAKEKVVARRLTAIEDLGNIDILCVDKTGTLTQNKLTLEKVYSNEIEKTVLFGLIASNYAKEEIDATISPFDSALFAVATPSIKNKLNDYQVIAEVPFDSVRMRSSFLAVSTQEKIIVTKGAAELVLNICQQFPEGKNKETLAQEIKEQGLAGKRILAIAYKLSDCENVCSQDEQGMIFLGYLTFSDPLKHTARQALDLAKKLGVQVKIITGDSGEVSGGIAFSVGLIKDVSQVILGARLEALGESDFDQACLNFSVFARISPQTKLKIIRSLQKKYDVGFMGEGTNDALALKAANVGIVVMEASDIAREASDIVLTEKDLRVVVNGIKNGRSIFSNINKYIKCALASNFGNFYSIAIISLFIPFLPMLPVQILLGNLLSDFPLITIATDSVDPAELKRPKAYRLSHMVSLIIILALVSTMFDFIFFAIFYHRIEPAQMQTLWYIESILTEIALIFSIRTSQFFLKAKRPSWPLVWFAIFDAILVLALPFLAFGQTAFHFVAPPLQYLVLVLGLVGCYFITSELAKLAYFKWLMPRHKIL